MNDIMKLAATIALTCAMLATAFLFWSISSTWQERHTDQVVTSAATAGLLVAGGAVAAVGVGGALVTMWMLAGRRPDGRADAIIRHAEAPQGETARDYKDRAAGRKYEAEAARIEGEAGGRPALPAPPVIEGSFVDLTEEVSR